MGHEVAVTPIQMAMMVAAVANGAEPQEALREVVDFLIDETLVGD
jgi:hypothetical protein